MVSRTVLPLCVITCDIELAFTGICFELKKGLKIDIYRQHLA
jgi:hypothetical protein